MSELCSLFVPLIKNKKTLQLNFRSPDSPIVIRLLPVFKLAVDFGASIVAIITRQHANAVFSGTALLFADTLIESVYMLLPHSARCVLFAIRWLYHVIARSELCVAQMKALSLVLVLALSALVSAQLVNTFKPIR